MIAAAKAAGSVASTKVKRPLELGCDIVLHSGTKFINGHSYVVCGFAVVADAALGKRLRSLQNAFGPSSRTAT